MERDPASRVIGPTAKKGKCSEQSKRPWLLRWTCGSGIILDPSLNLTWSSIMGFLVNYKEGGIAQFQDFWSSRAICGVEVSPVSMDMLYKLVDFMLDRLATWPLLTSILWSLLSSPTAIVWVIFFISFTPFLECFLNGYSPLIQLCKCQICNFKILGWYFMENIGQG